MLWLFQYYYENLTVSEDAVLCPPLMTEDEPFTADACDASSPPLMRDDFLIVVDDFGVDVVDDSGGTIVEDSFDG